MNELIKSVESQLIKDINKDNGSDIKEEQIEFKRWLPTAGEDVTLVIRGKNGLYGVTPTNYKRLDIANFFRFVPVRLSLARLNDTFTGKDIIDLMNSYWPTVLMYEDVSDKFLNTTYPSNIGSVDIVIMPNSKHWVGTLNVVFVTPIIDLVRLWKGIPRISPKPPSINAVYAYGVNFSSYGKFLNGLTPDDLDYDYILEMIKPGLNYPKFSELKFLYNGPRDSVPAPYTGTTKPDMSHVLIMQNPSSSDKEVLFIHYNLN